MHEQIFRSCAGLRILLLRYELQAFPSDARKVLFGAGEKPPAVRIRSKPLRVALQNRWSIVPRVRADGEQPERQLARKLCLQFAHASRHGGAGAAATGEDD